MIDLYLFDRYDPGSGYGIGTYVRQLSACLGSAGFRLNTVYSGAPCSRFEVTEADGMRRFYLPAPADCRPGENGADARRLGLYLLIPYIAPERENVFLLNYPEGSAFVEFLRTYWPAAPVVHVIHFLEKQRETDSGEAAFYRSVDRLVCLSADTRAYLLQRIDGLDPAAVVRIPNAAADLYRPLADAERDAIRKRLYLSAGEQVVLYVGRIDMLKGVAELLYAFRLLLAEDPGCRLVLAGDGALETYLSVCDGIWSRVTFTGKLAPDRLADWYRIADLGVIPSWYEQCSYTAIEMMMYGLPAVVSAVPGLDEMFEAGKDAVAKVACTPGNSHTETNGRRWFRAISGALSDPAGCRRVGRNARQTYLGRYAFGRWRKEYTELFVECIKNKTK